MLENHTVKRALTGARDVMTEWTDRLRAEAGDWPAKVSAFHPQMAVQGRFGQPCPECGAPVQRIVHASQLKGSETNYCARCQSGGKLLADHAMSRLLRALQPGDPSGRNGFTTASSFAT